MREATVGQLLINEALPEDLRNDRRVLDKKGVAALLRDIAHKYPEQYRDVVHKLSQLGADFATTSGVSLSIDDLRPSAAKKRIADDVRAFVTKLSQQSNLPEAQRNKLVIEYLASRMDEMRDATFDESVRENNNFAEAIMSGARGNKANLSSLRGADLMVLDHKDRPIPVPVLNNYTEGLSPAEYFAASYGTRKGIIATKMCLCEGTEVILANGSIKRIEDIKVRDVVLGSDMRGTLLPTEVVRTYANGVKPCYKYTFRVPRTRVASAQIELCATDDHRILTCKFSATRTHGCHTRYAIRPLSDGRIYRDPMYNAFFGVVAASCVEYGGIDESRTKEDDPYAFRLHHKEFLGDRPTYDIEVDNDTHLFALANGLIVSNSTAQAGYLTKLLTNAAGNLVVTDDAPAANTGTPVETNDPDNIGAVLARDYGPFNAGTVITPSILKSLANHQDEILVHSPISAGGAGVPRLAAGVREKGRLASVGENVGLAAAQAIGEPISQAQLCLVRGTLVRMANGAAKRIENVRKGMMVIGIDSRGSVFPVRVVNTYDNGRRPCVETTFLPLNNSPKLTLKSTADHKILSRLETVNISAGVVPVKEAASAIYATSTDFIKEPRRVPFIDKTVAVFRLLFFWLMPTPARPAQTACAMYIGQRDIGLQHTYDIEVDHPDHLFVLANGLIVSNSSKHAAGVVGSTRGTSVSGFDAVNQLVQIPKSFRNAAAVARLDGRVTKIAPAPQGGHYVWLNEEQHYVFPESDVSVKVGDPVSAGDALSSGVPNPAEVVKYKGIGEGRRYFVQQLRKTLTDNDIPSHRRNIELLARGLINHVRVVEPDGIEDALPDDILPYDEVVRRYRPRFGYTTMPPSRARGKYLERPVLHYSIGTRVTPSVSDTLKRHKVDTVDVHDDPPPFEPHMVRALELAVHDPDFFRRLSGFYIGKGFMNAVQRGGSSPIHSQNWPHALAHGVDFGKELETKGIY